MSILDLFRKREEEKPEPIEEETYVNGEKED